MRHVRAKGDTTGATNELLARQHSLEGHMTLSIQTHIATEVFSRLRTAKLVHQFRAFKQFKDITLSLSEVLVLDFVLLLQFGDKVFKSDVALLFCLILSSFDFLLLQDLICPHKHIDILPLLFDTF